MEDDVQSADSPLAASNPSTPQAAQENLAASANTKVAPLSVFDTEYSADSVESCPIDDYCDILVCGTYQLLREDNQAERSSSHRVGCLHVFKVGETLQPIQKINTPAVLDAKWCRHKILDSAILGVANAIGELEILRLTTVDERMSLVTDTKRHFVRKSGTLALALDFSTGKYACNSDPKIVVSDSDGHATLFQLEQTELRQLSQWAAHDYEAWITAFDYWSPTIVYSGGDDCRFKKWDTRIQLDGKPCFSSSRHTMGVTSIQCNYWTEHVVATGSYDERVFLWDTRRMKSPLYEVATGGGVWRLKWDPKDESSRYLLAACMHAGVCVLDTKGNDPHVALCYKEHESIAYGIDWIHTGSRSNERLIASCSFYDHSLHVWKFQPEETTT